MRHEGLNLKDAENYILNYSHMKEKERYFSPACEVIKVAHENALMQTSMDFTVANPFGGSEDDWTE